MAFRAQCGCGVRAFIHALFLLALVSGWRVGAQDAHFEDQQALSDTHLLSSTGGASRFGDVSFECGWRAVAYDFGRALLPAQGTFATLFDALQLGPLCNATLQDDVLPHARSKSAPRAWSAGKVGGHHAQRPSAEAEKRSKTSTADLVLYVDPVGGSDSNPGTQAQPLRTINVAVAKSRAVQSGKTIILRGGTHFLNETIVLGPEDSTLTITAFAGETPVVSGGVPLTVQWTPYNVTPASGCANNTCMFANFDNIFDQVPSPYIFNLSRTDTPEGCREACATHSQCMSFTWYDNSFGAEWTNTCWIRTDSVWAPFARANPYAGCKLGVQGCVDPSARNIYVAKVAGNVGPVEGLHFATPDGQLHRAIRARFPNSDPEYIPNYLTAGTWEAPSNPGCNSEQVVFEFPESYDGMFRDFRLGYGGTCDVYETDPSSYWCQPNGRTGGKTYCVRSPSGLKVSQTILPNMPYRDPSNAVLSAWRGDGEWFNWYWRVARFDSASSVFVFGEGGFQGGEGSDHGGRWFIENVLEELDYPNEYYYDPASGSLYYYHNGTGAPPSSMAFAAANLTVLFELRGGQEYPVVNVTFHGITFTGTAPTVLAPHGVPSGGDWALEPQGAITAVGTEYTTISSCTFERLDGTAVFVGGYNRYVAVRDSIFQFIGNNAVAVWGNTQFYDGTGGDHPRFTSMVGCLCREIGHYEKQSSCFFQAKATRSLVQGNVMFNMPRAAINVNDGFGGGNLITDNLVFNTCRESSDHGPFNSWDRQPFLTMEKDGITPSLEPADNEISFNLMVANYGADGGCIDNDDGSSWYMIHDNFFVYGGHKSDFDGHSKRSFNNVMLYANVYGVRCVGIGMPHPGFDEGFWNNTCVLQTASPVYASLGGCSLTNPATWNFKAHDNRLYSLDGVANVNCGGTVSLARWQQATGLDAGTTLGKMPSVSEMMSWGRAVLHW